MRRYLITGGAGLIGSHLADQLLADPSAHVLVLDDFSRGRREHLAAAHRTGRLEMVEGDICDRRLLNRLIPGTEVVFHQAAIRLTRCAEEPRAALDVLVTGSFEVFEAAASAGVRRVVAASSASVYGMAEAFPTPERHHPWANDTIYGAAKAFGEGLLASLHATRGLEYTALRYFNVYGPRMDVHGAYTEVLVRWMERIDADRSPLILGDGAQTMDFVYVDDVVRANVLAARTATRDRVFNVGTGVETSLNGLARALLGVMGSSRPVEYAPERTVSPVRRRLADGTAAREQLGFAAAVGLDDGLRRLVTWWRAQRPGAGRG